MYMYVCVHIYIYIYVYIYIYIYTHKYISRPSDWRVGQAGRPAGLRCLGGGLRRQGGLDARNWAHGQRVQKRDVSEIFRCKPL